MRKLLLSAVLLISTVAVLSAQVRTLVPIVRPVLHAQTKEFLGELATSMAKDGYNDAAEYLRAWAEGGFGSGFVYVNPSDGTNYVLTNSHVVSQAKYVTLEFEREDGSTTVYKDCPILAVSESLDLALIGFPVGAAPFKVGIPLATSVPDDGADVWSAGFPGLMSRPSWQFGKGSITNRSARIPELADPSESTLIQHSAPIDPGSSGGPLLMGSSSALGYAVTGLNTWKVGGRQDTNFAIPVAAIRSFLGTVASGDKRSGNERLSERASAFVAAASLPEDAYKKLARFISYDFVAKEGERLLKAVLASAPTKTRADIVERFVHVSPIDGLRLAIAYAIAEHASISALTLGPVEGVGTDSLHGYVDMKAGETQFRSIWIEEHGHWRLASFSPIASGATPKVEKSAKKGGIDIVAPYDSSLALGAFIRLGPESLTAINIGILADIFGSQFVHASFEGAAGSVPYKTNSGQEKKLILIIPRIGGLAQLPLKFGPLYTVPFVKGGVGFLLPLGLEGPDMGGFHSTWSAGAYVGIPSTNLFLSFEYSNIRLLKFDDFSVVTIPMIAASLVLGFY